jgi:hypothetical protein
MSIFKRSSGEVQETSAPSLPESGAPEGQPEQPAKPMSQFMPPGSAHRATSAPGVVPPPAAPIYSMRPPRLVPRANAEEERARTENPRRTRAAKQRTQSRATTPASEHLHEFDPVAAAQAGMLNLAWRWQEAGAPIRAIHTYMELLSRYPDTPGADAAVADLVELSDKLVEQGQFHTALAIYDQLEELLT